MNEKEVINACIVEVLKDIDAELEILSNEADRESEASSDYSVRGKLRARAQAYDEARNIIIHKVKELGGEA